MCDGFLTQAPTGWAAVAHHQGWDSGRVEVPVRACERWISRVATWSMQRRVCVQRGHATTGLAYHCGHTDKTIAKKKKKKRTKKLTRLRERSESLW